MVKIKAGSGELKKERIKKNGVSDKVIKTSSFKSKSKFKDLFFSELSTLFSSGVDIHTAFKIITEGTKNKSQRNALASIHDQIILGLSLNCALRESNLFSQYDTESIKIGEETGQLPSVLSELSIYYSRKVRQKKLLMKALSYPAIVLVTAIMALAFMLIYVVPMFEDIFFRANQDLPVFTKYIIGLSHFFRNDFIYIVLGVISFFVALFIFKKYYHRTFDFFNQLLLKIPIIGHLLRMYYLEKIYHSLSILMKAKIPVHDALVFVKGVINFSPIEDEITAIINDVMNGVSLANSIQGKELFNSKSILLIKIGEEVNQLDDIFEKLYKQTSEKMEFQIDQISTLLEPLLIIFVGVMVALILIAMYLPIFQIGTSVF